MPRREEGQLTIGETVILRKDAFTTRHKPALGFDELERRLLNALAPNAMNDLDKVKVVAERERAARDTLDDIVATGLNQKLKQLVLESETATKVYDSTEEAIRRSITTKLFGSQLDGIRIDTVDKLRMEVSRAEEKIEVMKTAKDNAELKAASTKRQLDASFVKIEEYLGRLDVANKLIDSLTREKNDSAELRADVEAINGQCSIQETTIIAQSKEIATLEAKSKEAARQHDAAMRLEGDRIRLLQDAIKDCSDDLNEARTEVKSLVARNDGLTRQLHGTIRSKDNKMAEMRAVFSIICLERSSLQEKLEYSVRAHDTDVKCLMEKVVAAEHTALEVDKTRLAQLEDSARAHDTDVKCLREKVATAEHMVLEVDGARLAQVHRARTCEKRLADMEDTMQSLVAENVRLCTVRDEAQASAATSDEATVTVRGWHEREKKVSNRLRNERNKLRMDLVVAGSSLAQASEVTTKLKSDIKQQYSEFQGMVNERNDEITNIRSTAQEEIRQYKRRITNYDAEVNKLKGTIQEARATFEEEKDIVERRVQALADERDRLRSIINNHGKAVAEYNEGLDQLKDTIRGLQQTHVELLATVNRYELQAMDAKSSLNALQQELDEANEVIRKGKEKVTVSPPLPPVANTLLKQDDDNYVDKKSSRPTVIDLMDEDDIKPTAQQDPIVQGFAFLVAGRCFDGRTSAEGPKEVIDAVRRWMPAWRDKFRKRDPGASWSKPTLDNVASCVARRADRLTLSANGGHDHTSNPMSACQRCVDRFVPCVMSSYDLSLPVVLPLPEAMRIGLGHEDAGYWIRT